MDTICTHDEAAEIVEYFENILDEQNVILASPEDSEKEPDNTACLYGSTYSNLQDAVEDKLKELLKAVKENPNIEIIEDEFSGNF